MAALSPKRRNNVLIIGSELGHGEMFEKQGWRVVDSVKHADLIQFTGGSDISPEMYGHHAHPKTSTNPPRDEEELLIFNLGKAQNKRMAGICRGGQFLNVLMGGSLWQHVDGHNTGGHLARDVKSGAIIDVSSTHHQMMIPAPIGSQMLMTAGSATFKETLQDNSRTIFTHYVKDTAITQDAEAICYPQARVLCFQPHPEYQGCDQIADLYFDYIEQHLFQ